MSRQERADVPSEACHRSRQRDFHRLDDVNLQHLHHFQLEAAEAILHGANPGEIPFYQVSKFELSINLKTAKAARAYGTVHLCLPQPTEWWSRVPQVQAVEALAPTQWLLWVIHVISTIPACPLRSKNGHSPDGLSRYDREDEIMLFRSNRRPADEVRAAAGGLRQRPRIPPQENSTLVGLRQRSDLAFKLREPAMKGEDPPLFSFQI